MKKKRNKLFKFRINIKEKEKLKEMAKKSKKNMSDFARKKLLGDIF